MDDEQVGRSPRPEGAPPIPDPTRLTTAALQREIGHLRELAEEADRQLEARMRLHVEAIYRQMMEADLRYQQRFETQKEAVGNAERAVTKRADEVSRRVDELRDGTVQQISMIQTQVAAMTGRGAGGAAAWGYITGALGVIVAIVTLLLTLGS